MKILNLYAGIGGNRKLWNSEVMVTAVEFDKNIAKVYQDFYPKDKVIITDALEYLVQHYKEFDFIWASPPCPSHSDIRRCGVHKGQYEAVLPDMTLYSMIIFLQNFFKGKFIVENVKPYYQPLITPSVILHRHLFWTNFDVPPVIFNDTRTHQNIIGSSEIYGITLNTYKDIGDKRKMLRNMVNPEVALYLFEMAKKSNGQSFKKTKIVTASLFEQ